MNPKHHRTRAFKKGLALHVVLKSNFQVFWGKRAKANADSILSIYCKYFGVKIYHRAYVGHHIHLILISKSQDELHGFLRVVAGQIALRLKKVLGLTGMNFWKSRPWSRVLQWGKDYGTAIKYAALNYLEGAKAIIRSSKRKSELHVYERAIKDVLDKKLTVVSAA